MLLKPASLAPLALLAPALLASPQPGPGPGAASPASASLLAIVRPPHEQPVLARLDPRTLEAVGPEVEVGEYHYAWSLSPDRSQLALATGGPRGSVRIVDLARMAVVRDVRCGGAAEAIGWLTPHRLVAALQSGDVVVVDPTSGAIVRRHSTSVDFGPRTGRQPAVRAGSGLAVLLTDAARVSPAILAVADAEGGLRTVSLDRIQVGSKAMPSANNPDARMPERADLAFDPDRQRILVVGAHAPVAEVDLGTLRVQYRPVSGLAALDTRCPGGGPPGQRGAPCSSTRRALWVGDGRLAVFGSDYLPRPGRIPDPLPSGVALVDTRDWTARIVDPEAGYATVADRTLLVYGGPPGPLRKGLGLRAYDLDGRLRSRLFDKELLHAVSVASGTAYAVTGDDAVRVVGLAQGKELRKVKPPWLLIDVVGERE